MTDKPLLLLDVDGPLNPYAVPSTRRPAGYETHRLKPKGWDTPLRVWLNPRHGRMLLNLTRWVDLVWATTWREEANSLIGPQIGLPQLPVIPIERPTHLGQHIWKLSAVVDYVGDRAFAWIDDDFTRDDFDWAAVRNVEVASTLLLSIDPAIGINQHDLDRVERWAHLQHTLGNQEGD